MQVNPFDYISRTGGQSAYPDEASYNEAMVSAMVAEGISLIGITDHHAATRSQGLRRAAEEAGITALPGFEAHTKDGVHFLCLFDPSVDEAYIERCIGACGVGDAKSELAPGSKDCLELLELVNEWQAVAIAAHATNAKGLLKTLSGLPRARVWTSDSLLAAAIPGSVADLPQDVRMIVQNKDEAHRRTHPIAILNARDVSDPADFSEPGAWTWLKVTNPTVEAARQAFLDPGSRVRLSFESEPDLHTEITDVRWEGGFLADAALSLNAGLNVLIGGRGSGKSTVVESIRYAMDLPPLGTEARKAHEGFVKNVLKPGTKVTLGVRSPSPADRRYTIERSVGKAPIVRGADGAIIEMSPQDVIPDMEVLGQHEIAELARLPEERARLLSRFVPTDPDEEDRISDLLADLRTNARDLLAALEEVETSEESLDELPVLEERMRRYDEVGLKDRLESQTKLAAEEALLDAAQQTLTDLSEVVETLANQFILDVTEFASADDSGDDLKSIVRILSTLVAATTVHIDGIGEALEAANRQLRESRASWGERNQPLRDDHDRVLRQLQAEGVDGNDYLVTQRRVERLGPTSKRLSKQRARVKDLEVQRREMLVQLDDLRAARFRREEAAAKSVSRQLKPDLRISVQYQGARGTLHDFLDEAVGGRLDSVRRELDALPALSLADFARHCRDGADALQSEYGFTKMQAESLAAADERVFLELEELDLVTTASIELNVAASEADPVWRDLGELSTGQRATAVLILLLHGGDSPLVIDQPEDDLDNAFISDGVVPRLREAKTKRQFVLTSHNPNIPVLADAELIAVLAASGDADGSGRSEVETSGSIDSDAVRAVVELLEGGKLAFDQRRRRYRF